jgi:hypothetical protein
MVIERRPKLLFLAVIESGAGSELLQTELRKVFQRHLRGTLVAKANVFGKQLTHGRKERSALSIFELAVARTRLREEEARKAGFDPLTVQSAFWDHKAYYPGAQVRTDHLLSVDHGLDLRGGAAAVVYFEV